MPHQNEFDTSESNLSSSRYQRAEGFASSRLGSTTIVKTYAHRLVATTLSTGTVRLRYTPRDTKSSEEASTL